MGKQNTIRTGNAHDTTTPPLPPPPKKKEKKAVSLFARLDFTFLLQTTRRRSINRKDTLIQLYVKKEEAEQDSLLRGTVCMNPFSCYGGCYCVLTETWYTLCIKKKKTKRKKKEKERG